MPNPNAGLSRRRWKYIFPEPFFANEFSGGLNLRDDPSELAPNESPFCLNMTLDERGAAVMRLGFAKDNGMAALSAGNVSNLFYWQTKGQLVAQAGAQLYKRTAAGSYTSFKTFTTSAPCAMVDFIGKLVIFHPIDGTFTYDGTTLSAVASGPKTNCAAVWQNKVWAAGDPSNPTRLYACGRGDPTNWVTDATDPAYAGGLTNDLREVNDGRITCLNVPSSGALLAFKDTCCHRVNDPATGAYVTIDAQHGAAGPLAAVSHFGITAVVNKHGIFVTNGLTPLKPVADKLQPLFTAAQLNLTSTTGWCAGIYKDRLVFSIRRNGKSANDYTIEYHPIVGWVVPHGFGASAFATYGSQDDTLYHGAAAAGLVYQTFKGGTDDGAAITGSFQTKWFTPTALGKCRYRRLRLAGRGQFSLYIKRDYTNSAGDVRLVNLDLSAGPTWGTFVWGTQNWGGSSYENFTDLFSLGVGKAISFLFQQTSSISASAPALQGDGAQQEVGAFAVYGARCEFVWLGLS